MIVFYIGGRVTKICRIVPPAMLVDGKTRTHWGRKFLTRCCVTFLSFLDYNVCTSLNTLQNI